jgi:predicted enzyme related to lactoylglutathione lyase
MSIQVKELAFVFYPVSDINAARKFYEGFLGLKAGLQVEFGKDQWWVEYDVAGQALAISNAMPGKTASALALEVADLDDAMKQAKAAGVPIANEVMEFPPCRMFIVKDPSGNEITLHQRNAG